MPRVPGIVYDSFVIRLWHEGGGRLLRAEVEHVQTGAVHCRRGLVFGWITDTLASCMEGRPSAETGGSERGHGSGRDEGCSGR